MRGRMGYWFVLLALILSMAAGCGSAGGNEAQNAEAAQQGEQKKDAENTASEEKKAGDTQEQEELVLNERQTQDGEVQGITIRIYHGDDMAENICVNTALTEEITPEILIMNLVSYQVLPDTVTVESFSEETETAKDGTVTDKRLLLDLSSDFGSWLSSMGTSGEMIVMGSLVNTFLDAYDASAMKVTVEGQVLETGHQIYDGWLELYSYVQASYSVTSGMLQEGTVTFSYPQIQDAPDTELQSQWNERIENKVETMAAELEEGTTLTGSYDVKTMNDELLSILVSGEISSASAAYPSRFQYTYNIDMKTGENIRLAHYMDVNQIAENMMNGEGYTVDKELASEFQERLTILYGNTEQLATALKGFDFGEGQNEHPAGYSYRENGQTWLCMEVPHALGDFVNVLIG
ncbi:MAG TPA: GerMN domain-containing protein [Candidatus Merdisoma merdipullorum]|nr:GerMN domain-containing protein [Candidatus Merdisoma merdipullorum]